MARHNRHNKPRHKQYNSKQLKIPDKERHCTSKVPLTISVAQSIIQQEQRLGNFLSWYECEYCGSVHLTSGA